MSIFDPNTLEGQHHDRVSNPQKYFDVGTSFPNYSAEEARLAQQKRYQPSGRDKSDGTSFIEKMGSGVVSVIVILGVIAMFAG